MSSLKSTYYRARADENADAAESATLENVRVRNSNAAAVWRELGDRAEEFEAKQVKVAADKADRDASRD